ncbi:MAG: 4-hydroxy-tetrahydrodipicolinate synthase [Deltaproteobacteria bacterium]|nr:4-hydroxy-tetrahydrodipicolinate synthase [Deltaproteobacteria bacterium]
MLKLEGILTALVTPLRSGMVDLDALRALVERQIEAKVQGIVVAATTGEGSMLTREEQRLVVETAVKTARGRILVAAGCSHSSTWAVVEAAHAAADAGVDAVLVASPAYVRPGQDGIAAHYEAVADRTRVPIIAYNVPTRTGSDILPATLGRLAAHERIVGVKEATGSMLRVIQVIAAVKGRMAVLSGDDPITVSLLVAGGQGVISTASNVAPAKWAELWRRWVAGDHKGAAEAQAELTGLHEALFLETNPGPAKAALHLLGLVEPEIRMPLMWPQKATISRLAAEMERLGFEPKRAS